MNVPQNKSKFNSLQYVLRMEDSVEQLMMAMALSHSFKSSCNRFPFSCESKNLLRRRTCREFSCLLLFRSLNFIIASNKKSGSDKIYDVIYIRVMLDIRILLFSVSNFLPLPKRRYESHKYLTSTRHELSESGK